MNRILSLLVALTLSATTAWADIAIEKDDTFPSTTSISTKHENQGPWRIVMLDRDEDIITATFYITSLKPMAFDKAKNGVFTIDGVNLPAKLITAKKTVMTDYSLAAGQFDLSPLKDKFITAKKITVTCFFNTGQVVTWEVSPEVIEEWRVVFLLPDGGKPSKPKEQAPANKPGAAKQEPPKAGSPAKPAAKPAPTQPGASAPAKSPTPSTAPAGQPAPKELPAPAPAAKPAMVPQQEKPEGPAPAKPAPAEAAKPAPATPPAPAATQPQPPSAAAPADSPAKPASDAKQEKPVAPAPAKETPAEAKPAPSTPAAPASAPAQAIPAAAPAPRPLWQPHAPQPTPQEVKQPQTVTGTPESPGVQSFDDDEEPSPATSASVPAAAKPGAPKPAEAGEKK